MHFENAVKLYPKYLEALLLLGTAYMDNREWDKAESTLRQVLVVEPKTTAAHFALGELYLRQKKYSEAEKEMLAGIKLDAKSVRGHFLLGRLYYELGDLAKAGPQVGTALRLDPKVRLHARAPAGVPPLGDVPRPRGQCGRLLRLARSPAVGERERE